MAIKASQFNTILNNPELEAKRQAAELAKRLKPIEKRLTVNDMEKRGYNCQEALQYLGIKRRSFETYFRPHLIPVRMGTVDAAYR